jgi:BA14K-like protein
MRKPLILTLACGLGLLTAACETYYPPPPRSVPPAVARENHVRWCYDHHGGYDPRSNVYVGSDGSRHYCVAPWER